MHLEVMARVVGVTRGGRGRRHVGSMMAVVGGVCRLVRVGRRVDATGVV